MNQAALTLIAAASLLCGCAQQSSGPRPTRAAAAACRAEADRVYAAQNRVDLSRRDQRDTPFAANYLAGDTSRGLGDRYRRDRMVDTCLNTAATGATPAGTPAASGARDTGTGPTFSPIAQ